MILSKNKATQADSTVVLQLHFCANQLKAQKKSQGYLLLRLWQLSRFPVSKD